jgi:4-hydroxybenzoyl-CoA reductase subunit beta
MPACSVVAPDSVEGVVAALAAPGARLIAGGTDLLPRLKHRLVTPEVLVSLSRLRNDEVVAEEDTIRIGAGIRLAELSEHPLIAAELPSFARAASLVASPGIRNLATLGGNLHLPPRCRFIDQSREWRDAIGGCLRSGADHCHVVPGGRRCVAAMSSDCVPVLISLDATATLIGPTGRRTLALADYYRADGADHVARAPDELMVEIAVPRARGPRRAGYAKWTVRRSIDFPLISIALRFDLEADAASAPITAAAVVVGALAAAPRRIAGLDALIGRPLDGAETIDRVATLVAAQCRPLDNLPYQADYRRRVLPVHARRAMAALTAP